MPATSLLVDRPLPYHRPHLALASLEVARTPGRLQAHLDRLDACDDVGQVFGALVDLFIGLDADQVTDRRGALERYGRALSELELQALEATLDGGLDPTSPIPPAPHSLLSAGIVGSPVLLPAVGVAPAGAEPTVSTASTGSTGNGPPRPGASVEPSPTRARRSPVRALVAVGAVVGAVLWRRHRRRRGGTA